MRWIALALTACSGLKPVSTTDTGTTVPDTETDTDLDTDVDSDTDVDVDTDTDVDTDADTDTDTVPGAYRHTITVDGNLVDFVAADETFPTTGGSTSIAWDAANLYVGIQHPDIGASALHWVVITIGDGGVGSTEGVGHGTQVPGLPFAATDVIRFKTDDSYNSLLTWNGLGWSETAFWLGTNGSSYVSNFSTDQAELKIPFSAIGVHAPFELHVNLVYEGAGYESSFAPTPADSFVDGYDPDYTRYFTFDPDGMGVPTSYAVQDGGGTTPVETGDTGGDTGAPVDTGVVDTGAPVDTAPPIDTGPVDTGGAPPTPWRFTPAIDGSLAEWPLESAFGTSSGTTTHLGWDDTHLYLGVQHGDVATGGPLHWLVVYVGNGAGSATGIAFNTQSPALAFPASHVVRWKADDSYDSLEAWDGVGWVSTSPFLGTGGSAQVESGDVVELAIPLATLGIGDTFDLYAGWVYEGAGYESTYAATPAGAIVDGYDPDYAQYWHFDRTSSLPPTSYYPSN
jgi:hypothetical protein